MAVLSNKPQEAVIYSDLVQQLGGVVRHNSKTVTKSITIDYLDRFHKINKRQHKMQSLETNHNFYAKQYSFSRQQNGCQATQASIQALAYRHINAKNELLVFHIGVEPIRIKDWIYQFYNEK